MNIPIESGLRLCSQCSAQVDADARFCKHCGHGVAAESSTYAQPDPSVRPPASQNSNPLVFVGIALGVLLLLGAIAVVAVIYTRERGTNSVSTSSPTGPALSTRGQEIEAKILRGERLTSNDLTGFSPEELRILRNVHFARYGRKYERPGLGDYFFTRDWYRPSDDYKDSMVNSTDKANVELILSLEKSQTSSVATVNNTTVAPNPTPGGSGGVLTNASVETAVATMLSDWRMGGSVSVRGIQEVPQQNAAVADLQFNNFEYGVTYEGQLIRASKFKIPAKSGKMIPSPEEMFPPRRVSYSRDGKATLGKYNDGRWVLKAVNWGFDTGVKGNVDIR